MTRWLILGGSGAVGREMADVLASDDANAVVLVGRNRVLLEATSARFGCEWIRADVASASFRVADLPEADFVVDLTYAPGAHPRVVIGQAERTVSVLRAYADRHRAARVIHTGSWVIGGSPSQDDPGLSTKLDWTDGYALAKTAAERAMAREWRTGSMQVLRLGNVVTGDTGWGHVLLRSLRAGAVANPVALATPASLCSARQIVDKVLARTDEKVAYLNECAGFTWGDVLEATADELGLSGTGLSMLASQWTIVRRRSRPGVRKQARGLLSATARRALWTAPLAIAKGPADTLPIPGPVLATARKVLQPQRTQGGPQIPPTLPTFGRMPGARREPVSLDALVAVISTAYRERGYGVASEMLGDRSS